MQITFHPYKSEKSLTDIYLIEDTKVLPKTISSHEVQQLANTALDQSPGFKAKEGQYVELFSPSLGHIIVVGMGDSSKFNLVEARNLGGRISSILNAKKLSAARLITSEADLLSEDSVAEVVHGMQLRNYAFTEYYVNKKDEHLLSLTAIEVVDERADKISALHSKLTVMAEGVHLARDLVSEPANVLYPETFAERCLPLQKMGVKVTVLSEEQMAKEGMHALLGVGLGSERSSHVVVMEWKHDGYSGPIIALAGKGVCFDSGGLNIKNSGCNIADMKQDMAGAAAVVGAMHVLAKNNVNAHVVGIIGLVENMVSGRAQRPSDVVRTMSGQTVEVENTDAEGRLVLCDIIWYVQQHYKPECLVDIATLTGAVVVALGENGYAGLLANDDELAGQLLDIGQNNGELLWRLPLADFYDKQIDSHIADMRNTGTVRGAGSTTAAQFLQRFVQKGCKWAHLDIANVEWNKKGAHTIPKGATGFGVNTLVDLVQLRSQKRD